MEIHETTDRLNAPLTPVIVEPDIEITLKPGPSYKLDFGTKLERKKASDTRFQCPICRTLFRRRDHLRRHNKTVHCAEKVFICPVCNLDYKDQELLSLHLSESHPEAHHYFCAECQYTATDLQSLISHKKVHIINKLVCKICNACFKRQDHLNRHIKSLHLQQRVTCEVCTHIFKRRDHLQRHMREQHGIDLTRLGRR